MMTMKRPKVQVVCITYKHEKYLAEALDSFVRQKTDFPFEVLVGDDCSPDSTGKIAEEYAKRYPDIIKNIPREHNLGPTRNMMDLISRCTAPYLAFCEGDDYWVDEYKLQKQHDFMEKNPECGFCFTKTRIVFPEDWGIIKWYKPIDGQILVPDSLPGYKRKEWFGAEDLVDVMPAQTSSYFFRWNYDIEFPEWFHGGVVGDFPMLMIQLGKQKAGFIPEVTSVYRRSEAGVFMTDNQTEFFINTRKEYVRFLHGLYTYFIDHYDGVASFQLEQRLKREITNLISACNSIEDYTALSEVLERYPQAMAIGMKSMMNIWNDHKLMIAHYSWEGYLTVARNKEKMRQLAPYIANARKGVLIGKGQHKATKIKIRNWWKRTFIDRIFFDEKYYKKAYKDVVKKGMNPRTHYFKQGWKEGRRPYPPKFKVSRKIKSFFWYWLGLLVPKKKNRWVFTSFRKIGYVDNTKYMYEYVVKHHPEIEAVWLTLDNNVFTDLKQKGLPVRNMKKSRLFMLRSKIAFTDHFRCSDYDNRFGFNAGTKVVQLWHGIGLKSIGDLKNTDVPGVQFCDDILPQSGDSLWRKIGKKFSYVFKAPYRELFEKYFLLVCPGVERVKQIAEPWGIPEKSIMYSGHPRNIYLHSSEVNTESPRILYAPTYRWSPTVERGMVDNMVKHAGEIQQLMEKWNAHFTIRLHPHTWRNYKSVILSGIKDYDRIKLDEEKDIYTRLGDYSVVITDYSSIAYDFILLNRPVVFYAFDIDDFLTSEVKLNYPFETHSPGVQTRDWESTIAAIDEYLDNPEKDSDWRCRIRDEFYDMSVNDAENSGRIVRELKKRLNIK